MNKLYTLLFTLILSIAALANERITAVQTGNWGNTSTWDLRRLPLNGNVVIIPAGITVTITDIQSFSTDAFDIHIYGTLRLANGKLNIPSTSTVIVYTGGTLVGSGSPSETIRIGNVQQYQGTEPAIIGPSMASSTTNGFVNISVLPVKFTSFDVVLKNKDAVVQWATAQEINAHSYIIERSADGTTWFAIATVKAVGNSNQKNNYTYTDRNNNAAQSYYRIKQVDIDGRFTYTAVRIFKNSNTTAVAIKAMGKTIVIDFAQPAMGQVIVEIVSLNGQVIMQRVNTATSTQVTVQANALKGNYIVRVNHNQNLKAARQVVL